MNTYLRRISSIFLRAVAIGLLAFASCSFKPPLFAQSTHPYTMTSDVAFHTIGDQQLLADVYQPVGLKQNAPVVLVVHGGAWMSGDKWMPSTYARMFAENGIAAVSINYRLAPAHKFPAQVDDVRAAMAWIHDNSAENHWDVTRFGMFGYSAGAHLCSLVAALDDEPWEKVRFTTSLPQDDPLWSKLHRPVAVVAGGTPADFRALPAENTMLAYFFGGSPAEKPNAYRYGSPAELVSAEDPVTLFYHGTKDLLVPIEQSEAYFKEQQRLSIPSEFVRVEAMGHLLTFMDQKARTNVLRFMKEQLAVE
ncbi:MAG: alpha/beta hydrolase [Pirellulaceae bacterium]